MRVVATTSGPDWDAELTPAPRPAPRASPDEASLADVVARLEAIEGLLAEQSAALAELRAQVARLLAAGPDGLPGTSARRRVLRASES